MEGGDRGHCHVFRLSSQQTWEAGRAGVIIHILAKGTGETKSVTEGQRQSRDKVAGVLTLSQGEIPSSLRIRSILISTGDLMQLRRQGSGINRYPLNYALIRQYSQMTT